MLGSVSHMGISVDQDIDSFTVYCSGRRSACFAVVPPAVAYTLSASLGPDNLIARVSATLSSHNALALKATSTIGMTE
jgi:hypothetical protein